MPGAAFFDVDGTICATRSTTSLIWHRARQHGLLRHRLWLASLAWRAPLVLAADRLSRDAADALVYRQFAGLSEARVREDAELCCDALLVPACFGEARREMELHRAAGRRIVLLSGGIDVILAPLARRLGADLLAQRLEVRGGRFTGRYRSYAGLEDAAPLGRQAERKASALSAYAARHGIDLLGSHAYGDSVNDIAMLASVGTPVAVNADGRLRREAHRRGWSTRRWVAGAAEARRREGRPEGAATARSTDRPAAR